MSNISRKSIKESFALALYKQILLIFKQSLTLLVYLVLFSESVIAESGNKKVSLLQQSETICENNQNFAKTQHCFYEVIKLSQRQRIPSQLKEIEKLEKILQKWGYSGDKSQTALTLLKLGSIYKNLGATTPALESYKEALSLYQEIKNSLQEASTLGEIGDVYVAELEQLKEERHLASQHNLFISSKLFLDKLRNNDKKAREFYQQSLEIYQEINNSTNANIDKFAARQGEASILNKIAQLYNNDYYEKEKLLKQSLAIYQEIGDKKGEALILGNLSELNLIALHEDQAGWDLFNQAIAIYQEIYESSDDDNFAARQAEAKLLSIAVRYWWSDNQEKALKFHNHSLKIYREIEDFQGEALTLITMADYYFMSDNGPKELEFYNQALKIYQEIGDGIGEAKILDKLGGIYYYSGEVEKALEFYERELEKIQEVSQLYSELGDSETALIFDYRQPVILFQMGRLYSQLSEKQKEVEAYKQARKIYQKWEDDGGETSFLIKVAERYGEQENSERMLEFFNYAITVYREKGNTLEEANLLRDKIAGIYFYTLEDYEKGFDSLNQALKIYREIGDKAKVALTLDRIGSLYLYTAENESENQLENQEKALEFYSQAVVVYREIQDFSSERFTLTKIGEIYYELGNKEKAVEAFNRAGKVHQESGEYEKAVNTLIEIGYTYKKWGEKEIALKFYNEAISISQQLGDYKKEASILRTVGQLYYELENLDKAVETFNQARKVYQNNQDYSGEAWTIYETGKSYTTLGDFKKALDSYQQALPIYEQEIDAPWREERTLDMFIRMSRIYAYLGDSENSFEYCKKSLVYGQEMFQAKTIKNSERFREIGKLCYQIGETKTALESFEQYWKIYQKSGVDSEELGLMRVGQDYTELGDAKQALDFFNRARKLYKESGFFEGEIDNIIWIARVYSRAGNYQQALDFFHQGLRIAQKINNRSKEALMLTEIGDRYSELEDEKALEFYNQALNIYQKLENYGKQSEIINKIGELYQQLGKLEKALEIFQQALKIYPGNEFNKLADMSKNIAKTYFELGNLEKALEFFQQPLIDASKQNSYYVYIYTDIGKVYSDLGELEKALEFFRKSLDLLETSYTEARAENLFGIAIVEQKQGNLNNALTNIKTAISLIEETRTKKNSSEERQTFFASKQDYYEFYIDLLMELHQQNPTQGYDAQALNISERSKARILLELLAEANTDIRKGVDPELVIQERSLQQQLDTVERRRVEIYSSEDDNLEQKTAIEQERQFLLQKYQQVQTKIREKSPSYAAITQPQPLTLEQIQQQILDKNTLLLQYSLGKKRSFLWAVSKDNITSYELPAKASIEKAVKEFRGTVTNRRANPTSLTEASKSIYQMILAPVAEQLDNQRLAIVSDGILHYIPFAAISLPTTSSETKYLPLATKHQIVNLPSASTLSILRQDAQQRKPAPKTIAIVADPVFSSEDNRLATTVSTRSENWEKYNLSRSARQLDVGIWERLPDTRSEAEAILALLPESESISYLDFTANRTTATNPQLSQYKIIHFATHGLLNSVNPELSGIVLSMLDQQGNSLNGFLRLHDIFNLNFSADLVVLSACQTGLGKQVRGEGLVGLTRGFMYAGTPRVLVSLWNVDDAATAEMMGRFYRLMLKEKLSATEALKMAQLEMVSETEWKSPYYWAAFTLQGEWR
ncbi:MAG: tetratricopeptide repeat protein [Microcoleaceae cyanobacterium]